MKAMQTMEPFSCCPSSTSPDHTSLNYCALSTQTVPPLSFLSVLPNLSSEKPFPSTHLFFFSALTWIHRPYTQITTHVLTAVLIPYFILTKLFSNCCVHVSPPLLYCKLLVGRGNFIYSSLLLNNVHWSKLYTDVLINTYWWLSISYPVPKRP